MDQTETESPKSPEVKILIKKKWFSDYKKWLKDNEFSLESVRSYGYIIRRFIKNNKHISGQILKNYIIASKSKRMAIATINNFRRFLLDSYGIEIKNYHPPRLKSSKRLTKPITSIEVNKLIRNMPSIHYEVFTKLMYHCALRISETTRIKLRNFNWDKWKENPKELLELNIIGKRDKERVVFLSPKMAYSIKKYVNEFKEETHGRDLLFDFYVPGFNKYCKRLIKGSEKKDKPPRTPEVAEFLFYKKNANTYSRLLKKLGKEVLKRDNIHSHLFRHARLTDLDSKGVPISSLRDLAGHSNISITNIYIDGNPEKLKNILKEVI